MGLDMFLLRVPRELAPDDIGIVNSYFRWCEQGAPSTGDRDLEERLLSVEDTYDVHRLEERYHTFDQNVSEEVGYWRKANQIHNWFVNNVQNGIDDCRYHDEVTKYDLEELRDKCNEVLELVIFDVHSPVIGKTIIENNEAAESLLPTCAGFFFGDTSYSDYYIECLRDTVGIVDTVLRTTDFDNEALYYISSW